ncbi:MAG: type 1 glutamine amidotransferase [Parvibaculaceae bacterium]
MKSRIAYLENGPTRDDTSALPDRIAALGVDVERYWAFDGSFPELPDHAGFILSGSPLSAYDPHDFIIREHAFIRAAADAGKPVLGLCFGSQILASALCGRDQVFRRASCEVGYTPLGLTPEATGDDMSEGCAPTVDMFVWHNDEVRPDHPDMVVLARSEVCPNHIWRYRDLPVWGIQGHPEVTRENAGRWFGKCRAALVKDGADVDGLIAEARDSVGGTRMLANFVKRCQRNAKGSSS